MGFEDLIRAIGEEAGRQRQAILAGAEEEARAIVRQAEDVLPGGLAGVREKAEAAARGEASRILSRARLAARREVLNARAEVIAETLRILEERLKVLIGTAGYRTLLERLLAECLADAAGSITVRCRCEDRAIVEEYARRCGFEITVEEVPLPLGGVEIAFGREGRCVVRNALADRLERARPLLLQEAGRLLFGTGGVKS
jgi:vacuolar-type H+-ATPase subunit E/Vma4